MCTAYSLTSHISDPMSLWAFEALHESLLPWMICQIQNPSGLLGCTSFVLSIHQNGWKKYLQLVRMTTLRRNEKVWIHKHKGFTSTRLPLNLCHYQIWNIGWTTATSGVWAWKHLTWTGLWEYHNLQLLQTGMVLTPLRKSVLKDKESAKIGWFCYKTLRLLVC